MTTRFVTVDDTLTIPASVVVPLAQVDGAGGAAALAVGTTTGTVAAGDDSRIVGGLPAANLEAELTGFDANAASTIRVQQDARLATPNAAQPFFAQLKRDVSSAALLVVSDSTSNDTTEWAYLLAGSLATDWPTYTVKYRIWNDGTLTYDAAVTISTGTGANTLTLYNLSVSGVQAQTYTGDRFAPGIRDVAPDLVLVSLGHNETLSGGTSLTRGRYLALTEEISSALPTACIVLIAQNPSTIDTNQAVRANLYSTFAARRGYGFIDVHQHFIDAGTPAGWYADTIHPSAAGSIEWESVVHDYLTYRPKGVPLTRNPPAFSIPAVNFFAKGDFSGYVSGTPTGWTNANCTITKDTTHFDSPKGYAVRLQSASAAQARLWGYAGVNGLGGLVTLAVRLYTPAGMTVNAGRIAIGDGTTTATTVALGGQGAFRWAIIAGFPIAAGATLLTVSVYADSGSSGAGDMTVDRAILVPGDMPRNSVVLA